MEEGFGDGWVNESVTIAVICGGATGSTGGDFLSSGLLRAFTCCN